MQPLAAFSISPRWPDPFDPLAAERLIERYQAIGESELLGQVGVRSLLLCLGGNSPYLAELALREPRSIRRLMTDGPRAAFADSLLGLSQISPAAQRQDIAAALRQAKRMAALITAIADIGDIWPLEAVTGALSELAEATLRLAIRHLFLAAHEAGEIRLQDINRPI
jgi:[glutamine synthetase] adenylyltransferase / [glutamine synthetase]-adenylyl-L-tyrosine phosphorylase